MADCRRRAESEDTVVVEGNHYFPGEAVKAAHIRPSATTTTCGWKGLASYHTVTVDGHDNPDAAWYYATPKPEAAHIAGRVAFWKGVSIQPSGDSSRRRGLPRLRRRYLVSTRARKR